MTFQTSFTRDRLTWLTYSVMAYVGIMMSLLGPILPGLRNDLNLDYTQGSSISSAVAVGMVLMGASVGWITVRVSRAGLLWSGVCAIAITVGLLCVSYSYPMVLLAVLGMGAGGSLTQAMVQSVLSDRHGNQRPTALGEANVAASATILMTPLAIGGLQSAGFSWRFIGLLLFVFLGAIVLFFRGQHIPSRLAIQNSTKTDQPGKHQLPKAFWAMATVLLFIVSSEMAIGFWATSFLIEKFSMPENLAIISFGIYPASQVAARLLGSRLALRIAPVRLLGFSFAISLVGFPILWLGSNSFVGLAGLFLAGVGIANLFPLSMSLAVGIASDQPEIASARISVVVGLAMLIAPLVLGMLADRIGLDSAFGIVAVLLCLGSLQLWVAHNRFPHSKMI